MTATHIGEYIVRHHCAGAVMHVVRRIVVGAAAIVATALSGCSSPTDGAGGTPPVIAVLPRALSGDEQIAATATTDFGLALFKSVNARSARGQNLVLSPISASLAHRASFWTIPSSS